MENRHFSATSQSRLGAFQAAFCPPVALSTHNVTNSGEKIKRNVKKLCVCSQCVCSQCHAFRGKRSFTCFFYCVWGETCTFPVKNSPTHTSASSASSASSSSTATKRHKYPSESTHGREPLRGTGPRSPACVQTQFTVALSPLSISQMALIITGGVSVNEPSLGGHLLSLFQFPPGEYAEGGVGTLLFFPALL